MNFIPTHEIAFQNESRLVMLTDDGVAYTQAEWDAEDAADFEVNAQGEWLFQGQPFSGTVQNIAAAALGRKGGSAKTEAKADAARANGAKGGRPTRAAGTIGEGYLASDSIMIGEMRVDLYAKPHGQSFEFLCRYTHNGRLDRADWPLFAVRGDSDNAAAKIRRRLAPWESEIPGLDSVLADLETQIAE